MLCAELTFVLQHLVLFFNKQLSMKKVKKLLGIWMDHASANIMALTEKPIQTITIKSAFTHEVKEAILEKSEKLMHNKEQQEQGDYYKKLIELIGDYDEVVIFGPTDAKLELLTKLRKNHLLENIQIDIKQADKMTEKQEHAFVLDYFSKQ